MQGFWLLREYDEDDSDEEEEDMAVPRLLAWWRS